MSASNFHKPFSCNTNTVHHCAGYSHLLLTLNYCEIPRGGEGGGNGQGRKNQIEKRLGKAEFGRDMECS